MQATLASMLANRPILEKYNEHLSGSPQQEDDALSVAASGSLAPSIRPAWEEDDGFMQATLASMLANRPILEKYNEYLSRPAKVVDATHTHMTFVKMFNRAAAPSGIIKAVEPLVPRTMRHPTTDQYTLAPPAKQINQRDRNKRLRMEQQIPPANKFKQGDFNGQGVAAPADSVYEIAREKCEQWMATWIEDCGRTVPKQESSPNKNTVMCDRQEVNPQQLPHKKTPAQKKLDKQMKEKAAADKAQRTAIMLANRRETASTEVLKILTDHSTHLTWKWACFARTLTRLSVIKKFTHDPIDVGFLVGEVGGGSVFVSDVCPAINGSDEGSVSVVVSSASGHSANNFDGTSVSRSCATAPQDFRPRIGAHQPQDFPRLSQNEPQYNTSASGHLHDFDNSTIIAYSNSIPPIFMSTSNKEYFTPGNGANKESATQWIDTIGRTAANCAQNFFTVLGAERIEGKRHPEIAMKRCLCPGIPDPPIRLASATTHRNGINCVSINCGALLAVTGDLELMCCIGANHGMMAMCRSDDSSREGGSKLSEATDLKQFTHIHCFSTNFGALLALAGDLELGCCIAATHGMMAMCKIEGRSREGRSKLSKVTDQKVSVAASGSLAPSRRPAWEEDDGVVQARLATMKLGTAPPYDLPARYCRWPEPIECRSHPFSFDWKARHAELSLVRNATDTPENAKLARPPRFRKLHNAEGNLVNEAVGTGEVFIIGSQRVAGAGFGMLRKPGEYLWSPSRRQLAEERAGKGWKLQQIQPERVQLNIAPTMTQVVEISQGVQWHTQSNGYAHKLSPSMSRLLCSAAR
jgi:hypothetical protein